MSKYFLPSLRGYRRGYFKNDLIAGVVVAALSVPVAMGYAQVAGLPPVYGLYTSIFPVLAYAIFGSSRQLIFGMDAAASAVTGTMLAVVGISAGSSDAISFVPLLSLFTGVFLILFAVFKLGKFANYISRPVMSGFISGLAVSIVVGQMPKVLGLESHGEDFFANIGSIFGGIPSVNLVSLALGAATIVLLLLGKKFIPKLPLGLILLVAGTALSAALRFDQMGVTITGAIPQGMPAFVLPDFSNQNFWTAVGGGLVVAVVVFASSVLPSNSFAMKNNYTVDDNQDLGAYGIGNVMAAFIGSSPACASVSRTAASEQFGGKTQVVSLISVGIMALVVTYLSGLLYYMPQPLLSGIIVSSLLGVIELKTAQNLYRRSHMEWIIWVVSALGVLLIGILIGVLIGVLLSFLDVAVRAMKPPQAYLGVIDGQDGYYDLSRHKHAHPVSKDVVIYRFSASLFFGNIRTFQNGLDEAMKQDPKVIIVDASGMNDIDVTAAEDLKKTVEGVQAKGVKLYFAGAIHRIEGELEKYGLKPFVDKGYSQKTIEDALRASGAAIADVPEDN